MPEPAKAGILRKKARRFSMEKVNNGRVASWIALIGGGFSFVCVALLALSLIDPPSEFTVWGTVQMLILLIVIRLVLPLAPAVAVSGILGLIRSRGVPGRIRTRAWVGAILAGLAVLAMIVLYVWTLILEGRVQWVR